MTRAPIRIQRSRAKGWKMPEGAVYVGRPTKWGNPYKMLPGDNRSDVVRLYASLLTAPDQADLLCAIRKELRGKDLACWCPLDQPCHADVLLRIANADPR